MNQIVVCDRCGKRFNTQECAKVIYTKPKHSSVETVLCGSCSRAYERWLSNMRRLNNAK